jgi:hypothetical protein
MDTQVPAGELPAHGPAINTGNGTHPPRRPSRSEMRDRRRKERESGVPFHLDYDDIDVHRQSAQRPRTGDADRPAD